MSISKESLLFNLICSQVLLLKHIINILNIVVYFFVTVPVKLYLHTLQFEFT